MDVGLVIGVSMEDKFKIIIIFFIILIIGIISFIIVQDNFKNNDIKGNNSLNNTTENIVVNNTTNNTNNTTNNNTDINTKDINNVIASDNNGRSGGSNYIKDNTNDSVNSDSDNIVGDVDSVDASELPKETDSPGKENNKYKREPGTALDDEGNPIYAKLYK